MSIMRKSLAWPVLASYLFANTLAASLHDHGECCGHAAGADPHARHCHAGHDHTVHDHAGHKHHCGGTPQHDEAGGRVGAPHHCLVCDFFAQAPLTPLAVGLLPGGDLLPDECAFSSLPATQRAATTHFARGPPDLV